MAIKDVPMIVAVGTRNSRAPKAIEAYMRWVGPQQGTSWFAAIVGALPGEHTNISTNFW